MVADARFFTPTSRFVLDGLTARGPTVDLALKAKSAPDGEGSSLKLDLEAGPSATPTSSACGRSSSIRTCATGARTTCMAGGCRER